MDRDGNNLHHRGRTAWEYGYYYGSQNWCIRNSTNSMFKVPTANAGKCKEAYDGSLEREVANAPQEIKEICGADVQCLIEGLAGDIEDSVEAKRELEENYGGLEFEPSVEDPDIVEENEVFEENSNTIGGPFNDAKEEKKEVKVTVNEEDVQKAEVAQTDPGR